MTTNSYLEAMTEVIDTDKEVITILKFVCIDTEDLTPHGNKAVRNLGSIFGCVFAASSLGIVCVPPTVGLSLLIPAIAAASATGLITAAMACGGDTSFVTKEHGKKLKSLQKRHATSVEKLNGEVEKIRQIVDLLKKQGHNADTATLATLTCVTRGLVDLKGGMKKIGSMVNTVHLFIKARQPTVTSLVAKNEIEAISEVDEEEAVTDEEEEAEGEGEVIKIVAVADSDKICVLTTTTTAAAATTQEKQPEFLLTPGLQNGEALTEHEIAFTTADVASLVAAWNQPEPLAEVVAEIIGKLEKDCEARQGTKSAILALLDPQN